VLQKVFEPAVGPAMAEDPLDAAKVVRHLLLYKFEDKALTQIKVILVGDHDEIVAVEFVFIQLIEDSILGVKIYFTVVQAEDRSIHPVSV
jgi:hypothetical protein